MASRLSRKVSDKIGLFGNTYVASSRGNNFLAWAVMHNLYAHAERNPAFAEELSSTTADPNMKQLFNLWLNIADSVEVAGYYVLTEGRLHAGNSKLSNGLACLFGQTDNKSNGYFSRKDEARELLIEKGYRDVVDLADHINIHFPQDNSNGSRLRANYVRASRMTVPKSGRAYHS